MAQRRFSTTYNQELEDWGKFWEEHEVPQQKQNPHLKARLANLFTIGAGQLLSVSSVFPSNLKLDVVIVCVCSAGLIAACALKVELSSQEQIR